MVQSLVKDFIAQTHFDQPFRERRSSVDGDSDLLPKHTLIEQPSYIDLERHSTEHAGALPSSASTDLTSKNLVDVRQTPLPITGNDIVLRC